jgi:hypothetical protein
VFVRMGKKCTPASRSSTLPRRTRPKKQKETDGKRTNTEKS